jgi:hypothetical protein
MVACSEPVSFKAGTSIGRASEALIEAPRDYVITPAGYYHRSCVHEIESGAVVGKTGLVTRKNGTNYQIPLCLYPVYGVLSRSDANSPAYNANWIEFDTITTAQTGSNWYQQLTANWTVPAAPVDSYPQSNQTYFTFPGLSSSAFIIQPVIQYGVSSAGGGQFWAMASWHCDGGTLGCNNSSLILIAAGDAIYGSVVAHDCAGGSCVWTIMSQDVTSNQQTILNWTDTQNYTFATGGAVEVYNLTSCDQYPVNGVFYATVALYDQNMTHLSPPWGSYIEPSIPPNVSPSCGFNVTLTTSSENLYHNPVSVTASGGLTACDPGFGGGCASGSSIASVMASGGNTITVTDHGGHIGTITLSGATASGGLTACDPGFVGCASGSSIASVTAQGSNALFLTDHGGHKGYVKLQ